MKRFLYARLAAQNIRKNGRTYIPYILACTGTVLMFYNICFLSMNTGMKSNSVSLVLSLGVIVIGVFAAIFLFYVNSFLMKRRRRELGLWNILGMEKKHIARVMIYETAYIALISLSLGILLGILFSKLMLLLLMRLISFDVAYGFEVSPTALLATLAVFCAIFLVSLLYNLGSVSLARPVELLHGGSVGEREPKTKWLIAVLGVLCLAAGYFIALTVESPLQAIALFFVAVILVIIGTYLLFIAGSIWILKRLRKNERYYYQAKHFTSISGMLYRMKQNAAGLASICILSTMVLVMLSSTSSLYLGLDSALDSRYPTDIILELPEADEKSAGEFYEKAMSAVSGCGRTASNVTGYNSLSFAVEKTDGGFTAGNNYYGSDSAALRFMSDSEYSRISGVETKLSDGEAMVYEYRGSLGDSFTLFGKPYSITGRLDYMPLDGEYSVYLTDTYYFVVSQSELDSIYNAQFQEFSTGRGASSMIYKLCFDLDGADSEKLECYDAVTKASAKRVYYTGTDENGQPREDFYYSIRSSCRQSESADFHAMYGGLFFLGIFLGVLFIMATALIIYYKQVSEGYDDKQRFEIMQKVGMSRAEVKRSIKSQIVTVFFLPLVTAMVHVAFAFKMITKLLAVLNLTNVPLFAVCSLVTAAMFCVLYAAVYGLTARAYYRIVA